MCLLDLLIVHILQAHAPQDTHHTLPLHRLQLALALHEQHARETERIDAQRVARLRQHVFLRAPGYDEHVLDC